MVHRDRSGRTPAEAARVRQTLRTLAEEVAAHIALVSRHALERWPLYARIDFPFAQRVRFRPRYDARERLDGILLSDLRVLEVKEADLQSYLGGKPGRTLLDNLKVSSAALAGMSPEERDAFGRDLAFYDLASASLERECRQRVPGAGDCVALAARELLATDLLSAPMGGNQERQTAAAWITSLEYARRRAAVERPGVRFWPDLPRDPDAVQGFLAGFLERSAVRLWRQAQNRTADLDPWIGAEAMGRSLDGSFPHVEERDAAVFFPKGRPPLRVPLASADTVRGMREPWDVLVHLMEEDDPERLPLSPHATEELAEMLGAMSLMTLRTAADRAPGGDAREVEKRLAEAGAVWDGEFEPHARTEAAKTLFREIPAEASGLDIRMPEVAADHGCDAVDMAGGSAVLDFDRDGLPDLFICSFDSSRARLYRNGGHFKFEDVTERAGLSEVSCRAGASSADFDNDGWPDLLTLNDMKGRNHLFRNVGGRFKDVSASVGLSSATERTTSAAWLDFDRDGRLDFYVLGYGSFCLGRPAAGDAKNGIPNQLYHNLGGRFEEMAARAGVADTGWGLAVVAFDFDGDGWRDLYVANDFGKPVLYRNEGNGTFRDVSRKAGLGEVAGNGMGVSVADFDHDGKPDLLLTYIGDERPRVWSLFPGAPRSIRTYWCDEGIPPYQQKERLFRNDGNGAFSEVTDDRLEALPTGWGWNGFFFDAGNRGWQDIFLVNGWLQNRLLYADESKVFWRFDPRQGRFNDSSAVSGLAFTGNSRSSVYADFDGDGCLDVVATGFHPVLLFAGRCPPSNHWLAVRLEGTRSNRDGIGALVTVKAGDLVQTDEMGSQGGGYQNGLLPEIRFGLGEHSRADSVEVLWPSGVHQRLDSVGPDRVLVIRESAGSEQPAGKGK